jgi:hypothetical protein
MIELLTSLPFDAQAGAPVFPEALVEANPGNPVSDGTAGCRWQTISYTPSEGNCLIYVEATQAVTDVLLASDPSAEVLD